MTELENDKKPWIKPEIFSIDFRKTQGDDTLEFGEDDEYLPIDPSGGT